MKWEQKRNVEADKSSNMRENTGLKVFLIKILKK